MNQQWLRLPVDMRARAHWLICSLNPADPDYKVPQSINHTGQRYRASVVSPSQWMSFEAACHAATFYGYGIGYVLNESDPFTCIDLDVKDATNAPNEPGKWTTAEQFERYQSIVDTFDSFTEHSTSNKGLHIWIEASIGRGFKRDGIEIYSQERFIVCTGNVLKNTAIKNCDMLATNMVSRMRPISTNFELVEIEPVVDDWFILEMAIKAANSEKFTRLWVGDWETSYETQSEADLALMSMFTFYSESNSQCRSLMRMSKLGVREKASKDDRYLNKTLVKIRSRQHKEQAADVSAVLMAAEAMQTMRQQAQQAVQRMQGGYASQNTEGPMLHALHSPAVPTSAPAPVAVAAALAIAAPPAPAVAAAEPSGIPWPPGAVGALAQYIYGSSVRPVKEVSIITAIGITAGIVGKAWNIPQSGLNMYLTLIAQSGVGKEAMLSGTSMFMHHVCRENNMFMRFVDFDEFASGPALMKGFVGRGSFVNVSGEWGRRLKRIALADDRDGPLTTLRTTMTNLYQKSGAGSTVGGLSYSNKDSNIKISGAVALSFMGETTPSTFYESLTNSMMEDGFLSRFLMIAYEGTRPDENLNQQIVPHPKLVEHYRQICVMAMRMEAENKATMVSVTDPATLIIRDFNAECDANINSSDDESFRQMWNRAALKAQRLAAVLAVANNYSLPCIDVADINWAIDTVRADIDVMNRKLIEGDVGISDGARERKLVAIIRKFLLTPQPDKKLENMRANMIVPRSYISGKIQKVVSFVTYRGGTNAALDSTLRAMCENGVLMQVERNSMDTVYNSKSTGYRMLSAS